MLHYPCSFILNHEAPPSPSSSHYPAVGYRFLLHPAKHAYIAVSGSETAAVALDSVTMEVQGGEVSLSNVTVSGNSSFVTTGEEMITASLENVTFAYDAGNSAEVAQPQAAYALFMTPNPLTETAVAMNTGGTLLLYSDMLENLNVSGSLTFDLTAYADQVLAGGYDSVGIMFSENTAFAAMMAITATLDGIALPRPIRWRTARCTSPLRGCCSSPAARIPFPSRPRQRFPCWLSPRLPHTQAAQVSTQTA